LAAGFAALLTPCVFPMIPLTVSFFSKQKEGKGTAAIGHAFGFGLAIVITFTILGALLAVFIGASGANKFAANPWVNLFIALVLVVFAISLLGAFELRLPHQLTNWLNRKSNESSGLIGILFMALTISAVSFSCTAPFVGGVLAATAGGEWFYPIIGMAGFSAAFASPFVLFALFPRWLESLPQSGSWMNIVKVLLGFIELAAAIKFLSNADLVWEWGLISRPFAIATWIAIFLMAGLYLLGTYSINHDTKPKQIGTGRLMLAMPFILFSFYLIPGLMGASLGIWDSWLPPKQATDVSVVRSLAQQGIGSTNSGEGENWTSNYDEAREAAQKKNKPLFIDFTGYTCTNCRAMETNVFPLEEIQKRFAKMQQVRLYTDDGSDGPANQKFQFELTGTVALPTYVIIDPENEKIMDQLVGYANKDRFRQFLDTGIQRFEQFNDNFRAGNL
jgi:thiol:disulfide interchange protein DsbD